MNKQIAGFAALAAAIALAAVLLLQRDHASEVAAYPPEPVLSEPSSTAAQHRHDDTKDDTRQAAVDDDSETEIVMGLRVRKDRNCTVRQHMVDLGNGLVTDAYSCDPPDIEEPFAGHSDADLWVLSYSDAAAAEALGKRLLFQQQEGAANELMLRAVALQPDNVQPLLYLMSQTGSLRGDAPGARSAVGKAYIITRTAGHFDPSVTTRWLQEDLVDYRFMPEDIERLDKIVDGNLERMRKVQIEVFGESRIGEAL
ncbi:MAG: hypothetical protein QNJ05_12415 [Woeseiaceae bacterium]|nr:hypothetical protein [Woeseiaceae bacterium]